jgi:hypothetical protein
MGWEDDRCSFCERVRTSRGVSEITHRPARKSEVFRGRLEWRLFSKDYLGYYPSPARATSEASPRSALKCSGILLFISRVHNPPIRAQGRATREEGKLARNARITVSPKPPPVSLLVLLVLLGIY